MEKNHFDNEIERRTHQEKRKGYLAFALTGFLTLLFFPNFHLAPIEIQNDRFNFILQLVFDIGLLVYPFLIVRKIKTTSIKILFGFPFVLIACLLLPFTLMTCGVGFRDSVYYTSSETGDTIIYQSIPQEPLAEAIAI